MIFVDYLSKEDILLSINNEWSFVMVKSSVLLMNILALGLTLGSAAEAVKNKGVGPMDQFVVIEKTRKRISPESDVQKTGSTSSKKKKTSSSKRPRTIFTLETNKIEEKDFTSPIEKDQFDYLLAINGSYNLKGLTPSERAFVLKQQ